jgi:hypothetical protein
MQPTLVNGAIGHDESMQPLHQANRKVCRLIITRCDGSEILFSLSESCGWALPWTEILPSHRVAAQLTAEIQARWGLKSYCLFVSDLGASTENAGGNYAVLDLIDHNDKLPRGTCWMPYVASGYQHDDRVGDTYAIRESRRNLDSFVSGSKMGPFGKPGWLRELFAWSQERLSSSGLSVSGNIRQFNASPTSSLIRLETNGPAVWFKSAGGLDAHELRITRFLTRHFPGNLPPILGTHPSWNAWLSEEVSETTLDQFTELCVWERVAQDLAELQVASIGKGAELLRSGCKDLTIPKLIAAIDPFVTRMGEFMAMQQKPAPPTLTHSELLFLADRLKQVCSLLQGREFPDTLGHSDFNPGNILISGERSVFIDWAEACLGNPFITFEYLREHARRSHPDNTTASASIAAAYFRPWRSILSPERIAIALGAAPVVAVFSYALTDNSWLSPETLNNLPLAGYLRSLTRRMYREAVHQLKRSQECTV